MPVLKRRAFRTLLVVTFIGLGVLLVSVVVMLRSGEAINSGDPLESNSKIQGSSSDIFARRYHTQHVGHNRGLNSQMPTSPTGRNP